MTEDAPGSGLSVDVPDVGEQEAGEARVEQQVHLPDRHRVDDGAEQFGQAQNRRDDHRTEQERPRFRPFQCRKRCPWDRVCRRPDPVPVATEADEATVDDDRADSCGTERRGDPGAHDDAEHRVATPVVGLRSPTEPRTSATKTTAETPVLAADTVAALIVAPPTTGAVRYTSPVP